MFRKADGDINGVSVAVAIVVTLAVFILLNMAIGPTYRIYRQTREGEANLRQQEWEKKIQIEQAKAANEAATLNAEATIKQETAKAEAEVIRAKGVAEANRIIGDSLRNNEGYLRYLYITNIQKGEGAERIYIPTEAGMPILEAGNR